MGICSSKKSVCHPSRQLTIDLDDELRQKQKRIDLFKSYTSKGDNLLLKKDTDNALPCYEKALEEITLVDMDYKDCTFMLSALYQRFGILHRYKRAYQEALEWNEKAAELRKTRLPKYDALVAGGYSSLGLAYQDLEDYENAEKYYKKALEARIEVFGENHWVTAISYERIAMLEALKGNYGEALELVNKAHRTQQGRTGENSVDVAYNVEMRGNVYYEEGKYEEAVACYGLALEKLGKVEGSGSNMIEEMGRNMMHGEVGRSFSENLEYVRQEMIEINQRVGICYLRMKKVEEGKNSIGKAMSIAKDMEPIVREKTREEVRRMCLGFEMKEEELQELGVEV